MSVLTFGSCSDVNYVDIYCNYVNRSQHRQLFSDCDVNTDLCNMYMVSSNETNSNIGGQSSVVCNIDPKML